MAKKNKKVKKAENDKEVAMKEVKEAAKAFAKAMDKHMMTLNGFHSGEVKIGKKTLVKKGMDPEPNKSTFYVFMRFNDELVEKDSRSMTEKKEAAKKGMEDLKKSLIEKGAVLVKEGKKDIVETSTNPVAG